MDNQDREFIECLDVFAQHDYERAANLSLRLLGKRMFLWVMQVQLISLERDGRRELPMITKLAMDSFAHHPWAITLIQITLGRRSADDIRTTDLDERQAGQLEFYTAFRRLTIGDRESALPGLKMCAAADVRYPEQLLASRELEHPEPANLVLQRLAWQMSTPETGWPTYDVPTAAASAMQILTSNTVFDHSLVLPLLEILTIRLGRTQLTPAVRALSRQVDALYGIADKAWPGTVDADSWKAALVDQRPTHSVLELAAAMRDDTPSEMTRSGLPPAFVNSLITAIVAVMNNPNVREAISAIDPSASDAAQRYASVFGWAIPSLPPLNADNIAEIASALKASIRTNDAPLDIPDREVFAFLSQSFGRLQHE